jgi:hypothetical protein
VAARGSFRTRLRAFQAMRGHELDDEFIADLEFLENRDLDVSIRVGGMLAFNALMITIGTHPVSASPGAPLSLDAATQPLLTIASLIGIGPFILSSLWCLWALLRGEEFDSDPLLDSDGLRQRLFAAFVASIDAQTVLLRRAVLAALSGGALTIGVWAWILWVKMG